MRRRLARKAFDPVTPPGVPAPREPSRPIRAQLRERLDQSETGLTKAAARCHGGQCGEVRLRGWSAAGGGGS